jgi:DeoR family fructose operon transcriptional repressor
MFSIERKSEILRLIEEHGRVDVNDLSILFATSRETIRRDLREMEEGGLLKRTHGGAVLDGTLSVTTSEFPVGVREIQRFKEKDAICKAAVAYIRNGDIIFVDNSSTCLNLVRHIPVDLKITLITNSIKLLLGTVAASHPNLMVICLGGFFLEANLSTYGTITQNNAAEFFPNKSFMSCAGIHLPDRLTDASILEADTKRLMIEQSQEVFMLADHTKFERSGPVFLSNFSSINYLVVDSNTTQEQTAPLENAGVKVIRAK